MTSEQQRIGHLMSDFIAISATNALVAKQTDNHELWQKASTIS